MTTLNELIGKALEETLERMIDQNGLTHVVNTLSVICAEKAEHLRINWQDKALAKIWSADSNILDDAARRIRSDG
jgi:SHS2 domain-containing protein